MAEVISTAAFDINTSKASKSVDDLVASILKLDKELQQLQKEGKDTAAVEKELTAASKQLNRALSETATTAKGAAAQSAAFTKAQKELSNASGAAVKNIEKTNKGLDVSANTFRRSVSGIKGFGRALAQDVGGNIGALQGGVQGLGNTISGVAANFGAAGLAIAAAVQIITPFVAGLFEAGVEAKVAAEQQAAFRESVKSASTAIAAETQVSNGLFNELNNVNTSSKRRVEVVNELNAKYPEIIGNTNLLTASEQELRAVQKAVNDGIRQRILAQAEAEQQAVIVGKIAANQVLIEQELNKRGIDAVKLREEEAAAIDRVNKAYEEEVVRLQNLSVPFSKVEAQQKAGAERERQIIALREKNANNLDFYAREYAAQAAAENRELTKQLKGLKSAFAATDAALRDFDFGAADTAALAKNAERAQGAAAKTKEAQDALAGSLAFLRAELGKVNEQIEKNTKAGDTKRVAELGEKYREIAAQIKEAEAAIKLFTGEFTSIEELKKAAAEIQKLISGLISDGNLDKATEYGVRLGELQTQIALLERAVIDADNTAKNAVILPVLPEKGADELARYRAELEATKLSISDAAIERNTALLDLQEAENRAIENAGDNEKKKEELRKTFAARRLQIERAAEEKTLSLQIDAAQKELEVLQSTGDAEIGQIQEQITKIQELQLQLKKLEGDPITLSVDTDEAKEKLQETIEYVAGVAEQLSSQIIDFVSSANQAALQSAENAVSKQQAILDELLNNRETANAQQVQLERDRLDKLNAEREKAKNKEAIIAQAQIAINLALAVARAVAEGGGVASAVTVGLALTAAVFGFLKAKQASEQAFYEGTTYVKRGKGERAGRDTVKARLDEGEAVITAKKNAAYHPVVEAIHKGLVPADTLNGMVQDYRAGRISKKVLKVANDSAARSGQPIQNIVVVQPDGGSADVVKAIQSMPQNVLRGDQIHTIIKSKSANHSKALNRAKGY
jgi:hypothetical protein